MRNLSTGSQKRVTANKTFRYVFSLVLLLCSFFVISSFGVGAAFADNYTLSLSTSGAKSIDVLPSTGGDTGTTISADELRVITNCRAGYNLTISTTVNDNNLYLDGDSTNNTSGQYFTPSDNSTVLANANNTWGYYYNGATVPTSSSVFAPVPALGSAAAIKTATSSDSDIDETFSVYYGVAVSNSTPIGNYKMIPDTNNSNADGAIAYQITLASECAASYNVNYSPGAGSANGGAGTDTRSSKAVVKSDATPIGTGEMASQIIYEGIATPLSANTFIAPEGYYFVGWNSSADGSGVFFADKAVVTDLVAPGETITLYAQWSNCPGSTICYDGNGATDGEMKDQVIEADATTATLQAYDYQREDYGFAGWSTVALDPDSDDFKADFQSAIESGQIYGPMADITLDDAFATHGLRLYAVWLPSSGTFQDWSGCSELVPASFQDGVLTAGDLIALTDARDGNTYTVAKLADGQCWMVENLRLGSNDNLSSTDSEDGTTWHYGYGNYYTWADAMSYHSDNSELSDAPVCPSGWSLPVGGTQSEEPGSFAYLHSQMAGENAELDSQIFRAFPNNFVYSGHQDNGTLDLSGTKGLYWTQTATSSNGSAIFSLQADQVSTSSSSNQNNALSVRCLADKSE